MTTTSTAHQSFVDLAKHPKTERGPCAEAIDAVVERSDVIAHLTDVVAQFRNALLIPSLESKKVGDIGLRTLDPRTENCLDANVRGDQEVRVRQQTSYPSEPVQSARGGVEQSHEVARVFDASGKWGWKERPVSASNDSAYLASRIGREVLGSHRLSAARPKTSVKEID